MSSALLSQNNKTKCHPMMTQGYTNNDGTGRQNIRVLARDLGERGGIGESTIHAFCFLQLHGPTRTCALEPISCKIDFALYLL